MTIFFFKFCFKCFQIFSNIFSNLFSLIFFDSHFPFTYLLLRQGQCFYFFRIRNHPSLEVKKHNSAVLTNPHLKFPEKRAYSPWHFMGCKGFTGSEESPLIVSVRTSYRTSTPGATGRASNGKEYPILLYTFQVP